MSIIPETPPSDVIPPTQGADDDLEDVSTFPDSQEHGQESSQEHRSAFLTPAQIRDIVNDQKKRSKSDPRVSTIYKDGKLDRRVAETPKKKRKKTQRLLKDFYKGSHKRRNSLMYTLGLRF